MVPLDKGLIWLKVKQKPLKQTLGTLGHSQTYSGVIQAYSGIFRALSCPDIFKTVVYAEP